jgi:LysM domain
MTVPPPAPLRRLPRATAIAIALLVTSALISFVFVVERGGLLLPEAATPQPTLLAPPGLSGSPDSGSGVGVQPGAGGQAGSSGGTGSTTAAPGGTTAPAPSGGASAPASTVFPTSNPVATPRPTIRPTPRPTARPAATPATSVPAGSPSASRLALLTRCPGRTDCYVYVVRSGDNLFSIANYFGVPLTRVLALNPSIGNTAIVRPGTNLILPTPTR